MVPYKANILASVILLVFGIWGYLDSNSNTALIPVAFGLLFLLATVPFRQGNRIVAHIIVVLTFLLVLALLKPLFGAINDGRTMAIVRIGIMIGACLYALAIYTSKILWMLAANQTKRKSKKRVKFLNVLLLGQTTLHMKGKTIFLLAAIAGLFYSCFPPPEEETITEVRIDRTQPEMQKLYNLQDKLLSDSLYPYFHHRDPGYRYAAAMAFGSIKDAKAIDSLRLLLEDPVKEVRIAAAYAIGQISAMKKECLF